jgi:predicted phosphate transport protein (TIGR00153 family)
LSEEESSLLHWFRQRRNQIILKSLDEHIEKILDTLSATNKLIEHLKHEDGSNIKRTEKLYNRISMQERSADHIQDELANEIARGILPPEIREKLFRLVRLNDSTANWAKTAGKDLVMLSKLQIKADPFLPVFDYLEELIRLTIESVNVFRKMCSALGRDDQTILDNRQIIEDREREADTVLFSAKEEILSLGEELGFSVHYLLLDSAQSLENSNDSITSAADVLYTIVMLGTPV